MVSIGRTPAANRVRLVGYEFETVLVAVSAWLWTGQPALIDAVRSGCAAALRFFVTAILGNHIDVAHDALRDMVHDT
jgi:hypothetical protein